jgi:hypothetical protein
MRQALFICLGTGKLVYFEEVDCKNLRFLMGFNKKASNTKQALEWLENNGVDRYQKGNFEHFFDHYSGTLMRCWLHKKE